MFTFLSTYFKKRFYLKIILLYYIFKTRHCEVFDNPPWHYFFQTPYNLSGKNSRYGGVTVRVL